MHCFRWLRISKGLAEKTGSLAHRNTAVYGGLKNGSVNLWLNKGRGPISVKGKSWSRKVLAVICSSSWVWKSCWYVLQVENYASCFLLKVQHDLHGVAWMTSSDYSRRFQGGFITIKCISFKKREESLARRSIYCRTTKFCSTSLNRSLYTVMERTLLLFIAWSYWSICLYPNSCTDNLSS